MKRKCNVVMLPTEKATQLFLRKDCQRLDWSTFSTNKVHENHQNQHIYITSDCKIQEGDWYYHPSLNLIGQAKVILKDNNPEWNKIVATTDKSINILSTQALGLEPTYSPQIPESFIEPFAESNGTIKEVWVEWYQYCQSFEEGDKNKCTPQCDHCEKYYKGFPSDGPIVNSDNTITISLINE